MKKLFILVSNLLKTQNIYITKSLSYFGKRHMLLPPNMDFVRAAALELCVYEIKLKNLEGNVAEVGVYKGSFAQKLNILFPDKDLYLFDTFEGFDAKDVKFEKEKKYSTGEQDFSDTSVDYVLNKMPNRNKCIVRKGFFPETAIGLEDSFCFVSIDPDLYQPIYDGLVYFYPRLVRGGYIFIHDFNNEGYKGARQAVVDFCTQYGIGITPIPDNSGTAIIVK